MSATSFDGRTGPVISWQTLAAQATCALALRAALAIAVCAISGHEFAWLASLRDGPSYLVVGRWLAGLEAAPEPFDLRVFPGLPLSIAPLAALGLPLEASSLILVWLMAALVAPLCTLWSRSTAVGWAAVALPPSWLMYSTVLMSESELLALTLAGLLLARKQRWLLAGLLLGAAGLTRPMACFAVAAACLSAVIQGRKLHALALGAVALAVVLGVSALLHALCGYGLHDAQTHSREYYGGELFAWPFQSLLRTSQSGVPAWKIAYIFAHVLLAALSCALLLLRFRRGALEQEAACWMILNTVFVLCIGNIWGFHEFHRFVLVALPPLLLAFAPWLERAKSPLWWVGAAGISCGFSIFGLLPH